jgi:diazepam-binding inhibitor (GABA receptor modulating acyl-CoA-binding protein)
MMHTSHSKPACGTATHPSDNDRCRCRSVPCIQEDFDAAAEEAKALPDATSNDDKLQLYGLFKQASVGDVSTGRFCPSTCQSP